MISLGSCCWILVQCVQETVSETEAYEWSVYHVQQAQGQKGLENPTSLMQRRHAFEADKTGTPP